MASVAYHIRSDYNPEEDRDRLELETGQLAADAIAEADLQGREEDPWLTEKPFGTSVRILRPPKFVPATLDYNEWGSETKILEQLQENNEEEEAENIAGWYRALARKTPAGTQRSGTPLPAVQIPPLKEERPTSSSSSSRRNTVKRDKNNWFIARALESSGTASPSASSSASASSVPLSPALSRAITPTLADILERDPPPLPTEEKYTPPVFLAIGPNNKGYELLQKSGWEEGEVLGRASRNRIGLGYEGKVKKREVQEYDEDHESAAEEKKEVIDLTSVDHEIVDLTLSDDDEYEEDPVDVFSGPSNRFTSASKDEPQVSLSDLDHSPRALGTPLPTVLKSDRLGIGLKAKTTGSGIYRAPVKRITHTQATLEARAREAEGRRRLKQRVGKGSKGFKRVDKKEQERRGALLAYLNT